MRFKNSLAAAVAAAVSAVVFSAAFQPVQAAPILIDNFTTAIGGTTATGNSPTVTAQIDGSVGVSGLDFRTVFGRSFQGLTPRGSRTTSVGVFNSGSGTLLLSSNGAGTASIATDAETYYNTSDPSGAVNLTTGGNDAFQIKTGAVSNNLSSMSAYVFVADNVGSAYYHTLPTQSFWTSFTTYDIPFSAFPGIDFTQVGISGWECPRKPTRPGLHKQSPAMWHSHLPSRSPKSPSSPSPRTWCRSPASERRTEPGGCGSSAGAARRPAT